METYISVPKWAFRCVCLRWELWRILSWLYRSCLRHWLLSHFNNVKGAYKLMWLWKGSVLHFVGMMCKSQSSVSRQQHTFAELIVSGSISSGCMRSWMSSLTTLLMFLVNVACVCTDTCIYTTYILAEVQLLLVYRLQNRSAGTQLQCKLQSHRDWFFFFSPHPHPPARSCREWWGRPWASSAPDEHHSSLSCSSQHCCPSLSKVPLRLLQSPNPGPLPVAVVSSALTLRNLTFLIFYWILHLPAGPQACCFPPALSMSATALQGCFQQHGYGNMGAVGFL